MATKVQKKTKTRPQPKPKKKAPVNPRAAAKPKPKAQLKSKPKAKPAVKPKVKVKAKSTPKAKVQTKPKPKVAAKATSKARKAVARPAVKVIEKVQAVPATEKTGKPSVETKAGTERYEKLRKLLLQKREDIIRESKTEIKKYVAGENKQLVETVLDDGDLSVVDLAEDISLKQLSTHRETLLKIDHALRKFDEGTYGTCDECGDEISVERLMIMPFAILCRDCQEEREIREKIEKEEGTL